MKVSVVIPVWNGASVIGSCLEALFEYTGVGLYEVICVDNASTDESASLVASSFPQVRLLRQVVNLGFAGGVNIGIETAEGDVFILLNQDCIVQPGWLTSLLQALEFQKDAILGCIILDQDGNVDHVGAKIQRPEAIGVHLTELQEERPFPVEYISGAVFAFHRRVWERVGKFDEGFYPAYYEDADYCFRARRHGVKILCVPQARVMHLRSSQDWRINPLQHIANHHTVRYRFVCKHFLEHELIRFFEYEREQIRNERSLEEILGRTIAVRRSLLRFSEIIMRRRHDLAEEIPPSLVRQIQVGLSTLLREAMAQLKPEPYNFQPLQDLVASLQEMQFFQQLEYSLLRRIYFRSPLDRNPEFWLKRLFRLFILRPLSFIVGRDYLLLSELNTLHTARMDRMTQVMDQMAQTICQINHHVSLLETLISYEGQ